MKEWTLGTATECVNFGGASSSITTHYQTCWDGTYYWRNYYTFADGKHTLHLMRSADAITWTEITTYTPSDGYDVAGDSDPIVCIKYYNNNVYMIFKREDVSLNQRVSILKWDGSSLSVSNYDFSLTTITGYGGAARNLILIGLDICLINTTLYVMLHIQPSQYGAGAAKGYGATVFTSITGTYITKLTNNDYMSTGSGGSSYYYFLAAPSSAGAAATTIKKYSFNGSAIALVADYSSYFAITDVSYSETTHSYVMDVYYQTNQTEIFFAQSFLYWRSNTTSNWNIIELSDTATGNIGFDYLSINVLEWIYFAQGTKTWGFYISTQGGILILKHLSATAINYITEYSHHILLSAYNGFFVQTLAKTTIVSTYANTAYVVPKMDTLNYISVAQLYNYALDDEEGILLYDDSDNLIFMGYTDLDTIQSNNSSEVGLRLTSPMNNDLATTYSGTFTAGTAPETVISTVLGTCKFCSAGTLSASGLTLAGAITYQNTPKSKIITDMLKLMARCVEINSALSISAKSTPTDSTKTLTFETISSSSGYNISELSKKKIKASNVKLRYGPSLTLYELRGTAANEYEIQDLYPQITSATEIARIATQLLSTITPYYELVIDVWGNGKFTAGQSLVFSHTPESIPEETYYIVAENYNSTSGVAQIRIVNLIKYPIQNQIQQIQTQLDVVTTTANNGTTAGKFIKVDAQGDYKGNYALRWGTSGTPTGFTENLDATSFEIIASQSSHTYPVKMVADAGGSRWKYDHGDLTTAVISFWFEVSNFTNEIAIGLSNADINQYYCAIDFAAGSGLLRYANAAGSGWTNSTVTCLVDTMYHCCIVWTAGSTITVYLNGIQIASGSANAGKTARYFSLYGVSVSEYIDALYIGTSLDEAMNSLHDGQIQAKGFWDLTAQSEVANKKYVNDRHPYYTPIDSIGLNGFTRASYGLYVWSVMHTDTDAEMNATFIVPHTGNYKIVVCHMSDTSARTDSGLIYAGACAAGAQFSTFNKINGSNLDLVNTTLQYLYHTKSAEISLTANDILLVRWLKDDNASGGSGELRFWGFYLEATS